jgi:hypothetical protein
VVPLRLPSLEDSLCLPLLFAKLIPFAASASCIAGITTNHPINTTAVASSKIAIAVVVEGLFILISQILLDIMFRWFRFLKLDTTIFFLIFW